MSTHPPTMTTEQLIEACAREGVEVSVTKLARWVREGLIPASLRKRHGRGRGKGAEWLWERECLPRAIIIGRTLASGDPSLQRAAQMLARAGYAPSAERLRTVLLDGIDAFERLVTHRGPYLKQRDMPASERRRRLSRNIRRKGADLPDAVVATVTAFAEALHGLDHIGIDGSDNVVSADASKDPTNARMGQFISLGALRHAVSVVRDADLLAAYEQAGQGLPLGLPTIVTLSNALILPLLIERLTHEGKSTEGLPRSFSLEAILSDLKQEDGHVIASPENPAFLLRLSFTALLAAVKVQGERMLEELAAPMLGLGNIITDFARQRGFPGADALSLTPEGGLGGVDARE